MKRSREWKIIGRNDKKDNSLPIFLFFFSQKKNEKPSYYRNFVSIITFLFEEEKKKIV